MNKCWWIFLPKIIGKHRTSAHWIYPFHLDGSISKHWLHLLGHKKCGKFCYKSFEDATQQQNDELSSCDHSETNLFTSITKMKPCYTECNLIKNKKRRSNSTLFGFNENHHVFGRKGQRTHVYHIDYSPK